MRVKMCEKYQIEREEICNKIINILGLSEDGTFLLCELDSNIEKQNKLIDMKPEKQKYFAVSTISSFKPNFECKRPYLNIVRGILRQQNYMIEGKDSLEKYGNGVFKRTIIYTISRNI